MGSEMCIRDSLTGFSTRLGLVIRRFFGDHDAVGMAFDVAGVGDAHEAGLGAPVSYTHLTLPTIYSV